MRGCKSQLQGSNLTHQLCASICPFCPDLISIVKLLKKRRKKSENLLFKFRLDLWGLRQHDFHRRRGRFPSRSNCGSDSMALLVRSLKSKIKNSVCKVVNRSWVPETWSQIQLSLNPKWCSARFSSFLFMSVPCRKIMIAPFRERGEVSFCFVLSLTAGKN